VVDRLALGFLVVFFHPSLPGRTRCAGSGEPGAVFFSPAHRLRPGRVRVMKKTDEETFANRTWFFPAERLLAYRVAQEVQENIVRLARSWRGHASLRAQAVDAAQSATLNTGEGASQPPGSGAKRRHYDIALASVGEVAAAADCARALGLSPAAELAAAKAQAARLGALLGGLVRSCRRAEAGR
jgi:four helix bundle protein